MEQKYLLKWLKWILIGVGVCGIIVYAFIVPMYGLGLRTLYPELSNRFWPWLIFIWGSGIPCFMALYCAWKITANIGKDQSFTEQNASLLKSISILSIGDAGFFFVGNIALLLLNMSHPAVAIASLAVVFVGIAIAVAAAVLSHLVKKAAVLQDESDWTI